MSEPAPKSPVPAPATTWIGLFLALFGMLIIRAAYNRFAPDPTAPHSVLLREIVFYLFAVGLLFFVRFIEKRPLTSIGIGASKPLTTLGWGFVTALLCLLAGGIVAFLTHFNGGETGKVFSRLPVWLLIVIVIRAGIVEELCYRGYPIERLQEAGLSKIWAAFIPLVVFAVAHWTGGWANIVLAFVLGAILAAFYLWRRDLVANIFAHAFVDFLSVVLPRLLH